MIKVSNRKHYQGTGIYIGRTVGQLKGSVLGNPFRIKPHGIYDRNESITLYRRWLWKHVQSRTGVVYDELCRLKNLAESGDITLLCWCKEPDKDVACHGDVVKACIEWLMKNEKV